MVAFKGIKRKNLGLALALFLACFLLLILLTTEILLRIVSPYNLARIGHVYSENALVYGWGYNPHEVFLVHDPDTQETFGRPLNSHGWRDKDRTYENTRNSYRILILGDSVTFGAIVPAEKIYTRVLEDKLNAEGYNIEVISIGYGGWGTDQAFEALKREGLRYGPDIVIMQFSKNDLSENLHYTNPLTNLRKPFSYLISDDGELVREVNESFQPYYKDGSFKETIVRPVLMRSEILKRIYGLYLKRVEFGDIGKYYIEKKRIFKLINGVGIDKDDDLIRYLSSMEDGYVKKELLVDAIGKYGKEDLRESILRVFEKRFFNDNWNEKRFYITKPQDENSMAWRLYFKLIEEANSLIKKSGGKLAIMSVTGQGGYESDRYWFRISEDEESKINYLSPTRIIKDHFQSSDILAIDNRNKIVRARNDPHPNIKGNEAMAENIYMFLMENFKDELEKHRN